MDAPIENNLFYKSMMDNLYDGVYFVDCERLITYWNKGAERISGYQAGHMLGRHCNDNLLNHVDEQGKHLCSDGCPLLATIQDGQQREAEVFLHNADGHRVPVLVRTAPIQEANGEIVGAVEVFSNSMSLLNLRRKVDNLEHNILLDALTGIGNRAFCESKLRATLAGYRQNEPAFGLLFFDVDHFKSINDSYGHMAGDKALQNVALTLSNNLRATDICGRWGGEEFIVILLDVDSDSIAKVAEKLRVMVASSSFQIDDRDVGITVSIGATLVRRDDTPESLTQRADELMYQSKQNGRNRVTVG